MAGLISEISTHTPVNIPKLLTSASPFIYPYLGRDNTRIHNFPLEVSTKCKQYRRGSDPESLCYATSTSWLGNCDEIVSMVFQLNYKLMFEFNAMSIQLKGVTAKVMDCGLEICDFEIQSFYCILFWTNTIRKRMDLFIFPGGCLVGVKGLVINPHAAGMSYQRLEEICRSPRRDEEMTCLQKKKVRHVFQEKNAIHFMSRSTYLQTGLKNMETWRDILFLSIKNIMIFRSLTVNRIPSLTEEKNLLAPIFQQFTFRLLVSN